MSQKIQGGSGESPINRRQVLKTVGAAGAAGAGLVAVTGNASAHAVFYGCSQVCGYKGEEGWVKKAIIARGDECYCSENFLQERYKSDRNDPRSRSLPGDDVYCYEVTDPDEAIVGVCIGPNPHDHDSNYVLSNGNCADQKADCVARVDGDCVTWCEDQ